MGSLPNLSFAENDSEILDAWTDRLTSAKKRRGINGLERFGVFIRQVDLELAPKTLQEICYEDRKRFAAYSYGLGETKEAIAEYLKAIVDLLHFAQKEGYLPDNYILPQVPVSAWLEGLHK